MIKSLIDRTSEAIEHIINDSKERSPDPYPDSELANDSYQSGYEAAEKDIGSGSHDGFITQTEAYQEFKSDNWDRFGEFVDYESDQNHLSIPSLTNPVQAFAEVALLPSSTNAGEKEFFDDAAIHAANYTEGYDDKLQEEFDARTNEIWSFDEIKPQTQENALDQFENWMGDHLSGSFSEERDSNAFATQNEDIGSGPSSWEPGPSFDSSPDYSSGSTDGD